jgi:hypothetical protein
MRKPQRLKEATKLMLEHCEKYFDLVWYARANPQKLLEGEHYETLKLIQDIENKYPKEIKSLGEDDNWSHGFNSGMLAASRLYHEMIEGDIEFALENHPDLDS